MATYRLFLIVPAPQEGADGLFLETEINPSRGLERSRTTVSCHGRKASCGSVMFVLFNVSVVWTLDLAIIGKMREMRETEL